MEKNQIKVIVICQEIFLWQEISTLLKRVENVTVYPETEKGFYRLRNLTSCSLNRIGQKLITEDAQKRMKEILSKQVQDETLFIINNRLRDEVAELNAYNFYQAFLDQKYDVATIIRCGDRNEEDLENFYQLDNFGVEIVPENEFNRKLMNLFNF